MKTSEVVFAFAMLCAVIACSAAFTLSQPWRAPDCGPKFNCDTTVMLSILTTLVMFAPIALAAFAAARVYVQPVRMRGILSVLSGVSAGVLLAIGQQIALYFATVFLLALLAWFAFGVAICAIALRLTARLSRSKI